MFDEAFFDRGLSRLNTRSIKWDSIKLTQKADLLPMWVADMDFEGPPHIRKALLSRADHPTYGYTEILDDDYLAPINFWRRRHKISFDMEDLIMLPCVITGLKICIQAFTKMGEQIVIQSPVYFPFYDSILLNGRKVADAPLNKNNDGHYTMNLDLVESFFKKGAKLMILCSPHNPVSKVWDFDELKQLIALCRKYKVVLLSDEIHSEFALEPYNFTSVFHISKDKDDPIISLSSASKTFNIAGLKQALLMTKNSDLRETLSRLIKANGIVAGNIFALEGTRAAYETGDDWLDGLKIYLRKGANLLKALLTEKCPEIVLSPLEGTYLAWMDISKYGIDNDDVLEKLKASGLIVTDGRIFGENSGEGFLRLNIGCPHSNIEKSVDILEKVLNRT